MITRSLLHRFVTGLAAITLIAAPSQAWAGGGNQQRAHSAFANCEGCTIQNANFAGAELSGMRLDGSTLIDVDLTGANLTGMRFEGVTLTRVKFDRANLTRARFDGADVSQTSFRGAALAGAKFQGVTFDHNVFASAHLRGAGVYGSQFVSSDLRDADLTDANIASSNLAHSDLRGADLTRTVLCERANENTNGPNGFVKHERVVRCVGLSGADVQGVHFGAGLSCDAGRCSRVDPVLLQKRSDEAA